MKYIKKFENKTESDLEKLESLKDAFTEISDHWEVRFYFITSRNDENIIGINSVIKLKSEYYYNVPNRTMGDMDQILQGDFNRASNYFQEISKIISLLNECTNRIKFDISGSEIFYHVDYGDSNQAGIETNDDIDNEFVDWSDSLTLFFNIRY